MFVCFQQISSDIRVTSLSFLTTCLKIRISLVKACVFEVRRIQYREVIVVNETNDVFYGTQVSRSPSATIHPKAFPIQTQNHFLRDIFSIVEKTEVVLAICGASINFERHSSGVWHKWRFFEQTDCSQDVLNCLIVRWVKNHFQFIARDHFQHIINDVSHKTVGAQQTLHDLEAIITFSQLVKICVRQQSLNVILFNAIIGWIVWNRFLNIIVIVFCGRRVKRLLAVVQVDDVVAIGLSLCQESLLGVNFFGMAILDCDKDTSTTHLEAPTGSWLKRLEIAAMKFQSNEQATQPSD